MEAYSKLTNEYYEIVFPAELEEYAKKVFAYSTRKMKEYLDFFQVEEYGTQIKGSFFVSRDDFLERIKELVTPSSSLRTRMATGCFYGGEIQILVNKEKSEEKFFTLAHETFHLLFDKFVYQKNKYKYNRIVWLDESLAGNFDGTTERLIEKNLFVNMVKRALQNNQMVPISQVPFDKRNVQKSPYGLFRIIGRYLRETKTNEELLWYISQEKKVLQDGNTILEDSLAYFKKKYHISIEEKNNLF